MKEIFEDYYAADVNAPSGNGVAEPDGEQPNPKASDDELLG